MIYTFLLYIYIYYIEHDIHIQYSILVDRTELNLYLFIT